MRQPLGSSFAPIHAGGRSRFAGGGEPGWIGEIGSSEFIRWVQATLNRVIGTNLAVDGALGPQTREAVRSFQQRSGLVPDGVPGPRTEGALKDAIAGLAVAPSAGGADPCSSLGHPEVLDRFPFAEHTLQPFHRQQLIGIARCILATRAAGRSAGVIRLVGHTDPVGTDQDNLLLGELRAREVQTGLVEAIEGMSPGGSVGLAFSVETRGELEQVPGSPERSRRVDVFVAAPPAPAPPARRVIDVSIVVKSFIAPIGSRIGTPTCFTPLTIPGLIPGLPIGPMTLPGDRLAALALATDAAFSENPLTDSRDKHYRLFSRRAFTVTCEDGKVVSVVPSATVDTDAGLECLPSTSACLQPPPLFTSRISASPSASGVFSYSWTAKGRPHAMAEPTFQLVCPRTSIFIWHSIEGEIECRGSTLSVTTRLMGSAFPSHRVFVNGAARLTIPQGPFSNLWVPNPSDPSMVR